MRDTFHTYIIDSALINITIVARDTLVNGLKLYLYRLPSTVDSTATFADVDPLLSPANLIDSIAVPDSVNTGTVGAPLSGAELSQIALAGADSTLVIGLRMTAEVGTGIRVGSLASGTAATFTTFVTVDIPDTGSVRNQSLSRATAFNTFVTQNPIVPVDSLLTVGSEPSNRALIRFGLSNGFLDSATVVRATLELTPVQPIIGLPNDPSALQALAVVGDIGAKSPHHRRCDVHPAGHAPDRPVRHRAGRRHPHHAAVADLARPPAKHLSPDAARGGHVRPRRLLLHAVAWSRPLGAGRAPASDHVPAHLPLREPVSAPSSDRPRPRAAARWRGRAVLAVRRAGPRDAGRPLSARTFSLGGAFGMFDGASGLNPAALGSVGALTRPFTSLQDFRHVENPAGTASLRETRFPYVSIVGPVRQSPAVLGISFGSYTSRDFTLASSDTIILRDVLVPVQDTFSSRGGLSDLRFAGAYRAGNVWLFGGSFHIITGSNRLRFRRAFADTTYQAATQSSELSYAGVGFDVGVIRNFGPGFSVAATVRSDGHANVDLDSSRTSTVDLPYTFGLGLRWHPQLDSSSGANCWCGPGPARTATCSRSAASAPTTRWRYRWAPNSRRTFAGRTEFRSDWARATGRFRSCWSPASNPASSASPSAAGCGSRRTGPAWTSGLSTSGGRRGRTRSGRSC